MSDWLTEGHLAWFVIDAVAVLDTSGLHERAAARRDGTPARSTAGRAGYDPDMLLALLIYGYACGERSSRRFERLCATDVAFRVICAGDVPDHTVISRFRQTHADSFVELFAQVLRLCRAAGLAELGTVAIDGTKIAANASRLANRSHEWLAAEATRRDPATGTDPAGTDPGDRERAEAILNEAAQTDAAEDAVFGAARGDELSPGWASRGGRQARIRAALDRIAAEQAAREEQKHADAAARAERDADMLAAAETALAAELARREVKRQAWERQWEQAMTVPGTSPPRGQPPNPPNSPWWCAGRWPGSRPRGGESPTPTTLPAPGAAAPTPTGAVAATPTPSRAATSPTPTPRSCPPATGGCRATTPSSR